MGYPSSSKPELFQLGPLPPPLLPPSQESQLSILSQGAPQCPNTPAQVPTYIPACPPHCSGLPELPEHLHRNQAHGSGGRTPSVRGPRIVAQELCPQAPSVGGPSLWVCGRVAHYQHLEGRACTQFALLPTPSPCGQYRPDLSGCVSVCSLLSWPERGTGLTSSEEAFGDGGAELAPVAWEGSPGRRTVCVQPCWWKEDEVVGLWGLPKGRPGPPAWPLPPPKVCTLPARISTPEPMSAAASPSERFVWVSFLLRITVPGRPH